MELQANDNQAAIVAALESKGITCRPMGNGRVRTLCIKPDHNDTDPSFEIYPAGGGKCWSKCGFLKPREVADILGIDLPTGDYGLTLTRLAVEKGLNEELLREYGVSDGTHGTRRNHCVDIPYDDEKGNTVYTRKRLSLHGRNRFLSPKGKAPMLYGLSNLADVRKSGSVIFVEGESDSWACWHGRMPAIGIAGATTWNSEWNDWFDGITCYLWKEPDDGGKALVKSLGKNLEGLMVIEAPPDAKDASELYQLDPAGFPDRMKGLIDEARAYSTYKEQADSEEAKQAEIVARHLLDSHDIYEEIKKAIKATGYKGDLHAPVTAYDALISRFLSKPLNIAVIAPSASGKNAAVDAALDLTPASAAYIVKASSPTALIHNDEEYSHRVVVMQEADSIPEDGHAASAFRSLISDNAMEYEITERDDNGRHTTRRIEKAGPTGLITTSTKTLGDQAMTRMLQVSISDSEDQTREVMRAHIQRRNGNLPTYDTGPLIALQKWIELAGDTEVVIPYGEELAEIVPASTLRMRRDFDQLITVIQVSALLHQRHRTRDARGWIVATIDDYNHARWLLVETFQTAVLEGATAAVRATVEAVKEVCPLGGSVGQKELVNKLGISASAVSHRVKAAVKAGYLIDKREKPYAPSQLVVGMPIQDIEALPVLDGTSGIGFNHATSDVAPDTTQLEGLGLSTGLSNGTGLAKPSENATANVNRSASLTPREGGTVEGFSSSQGELVAISDEEDKERAMDEWL